MDRLHHDKGHDLRARSQPWQRAATTRIHGVRCGLSASAGPPRSAPDESAHHEDQGASRAQLRGPGFPEVYYSGSGEAVIPDALLCYRDSSDGGAMLRAFVEVDRATMGPERLAAKLTAYARLHDYIPKPPPGRQRQTVSQQPLEEDWRRRYPLFPRLLFVLDGTGPAGVQTRIRALRTAASGLALTGFVRTSPSWRRRSTCSRAAPPHPCGTPFTPSAAGSPGACPGTRRQRTTLPSSWSWSTAGRTLDTWQERASADAASAAARSPRAAAAHAGTAQRHAAQRRGGGGATSRWRAPHECGRETVEYRRLPVKQRGCGRRGRRRSAGGSRSRIPMERDRQPRRT
ncbi:replication-relaxation family protein [Streptomyces sp. NPDC047082]|uniref:replication-relaxation family protein n=1 Tax=Streptomyces sp. NPDC047082 TaxID=3155259 RepID=UPI0033D55831